MSELSLGSKIVIGDDFEADLRLDFFFCPDHGIFIPSRFSEQWTTDEGCPVPGGDSYGESTCEKTLRSVNLADWQKTTVRIEVNRKTYEIPAKAVSGKALRELAEIPEDEDLLGKGEPHEGELGDDGCYLLPPGQLFHPQEGMEFFSVAKDRTLVFAGIPIEVDPSLAPNRIRLVTGVAEKVFRIEGEEMIEETS